MVRSIKKLKISEHDIQVAIVSYLYLRGYFPFAVPNGFIAPKDEKFNVAGYIRKRKKEGLLPGAPDLVVLCPKGRVVFLEVKKEKKNQQPTQERFERNAKELGHEYYVVRSVEDVQAIGL